MNPVITIVFAALFGLPPSESEPAAGESLSTEAVDADWRWLRGRFSELNFARRKNAAVLASLLDWVPVGGDAVAFDLTCRPLRLERNEHCLSALLVHTTTLGWSSPSAMMTLSFGARVSIRGFPEGAVRRGVLSAVDQDAAYWRGEEVKLLVKCEQWIARTVICEGEDAPRRSRICSRYGFRSVPVDPTIQAADFISEVEERAPPSNPDDRFCRKEPMPEDFRRAEVILRNEVLIADRLETHPLLFRTREACRAYRRAHKLPKPEDGLGW